MPDGVVQWFDPASGQRAAGAELERFGGIAAIERY